MRLAALLTGLCLVGNAWAGIGSVAELTGSAQIKRGKQIIVVTKDSVIEQNDTVETKNGKLKIVFKDDTQVSVTEHSSLIIDDFVYDPKAGTGKLGLKAAAGTVRYVSGAIAKDPKNVNIKTPTAAIAVRGTDFVMSVNEIGSSMIILMPSCDWETSAVKGVSCSSGKIDVESGPMLLTLDKPYQATLVESLGAPPTPPITVNLFGAPIGNNLQIAPPKTMSGVNVVQAAKAAAAAAGVPGAKKDGDKKDAKEEKEETKEDGEKVASAKAAEKDKEKKKESESNSSDTKISVAQSENKEEISISTASTDKKEEENIYVKKIWKDKSETQQVAWGYESLSPNTRNYANVLLPLDTKVQVTVTQDMQSSTWIFGGAKPQGQIFINQNFR
jgi:FecR protein